jgi:hypothetical protein
VKKVSFERKKERKRKKEKDKIKKLMAFCEK